MRLNFELSHSLQGYDLASPFIGDDHLGIRGDARVSFAEHEFPSF